MLWYDEPWQFENARPWSHRVPIAVHVAAVLLGVGLALVLGMLGAPWPAVLASAAFALAWAGAVAAVEYRFARWVAGNDGRTLLEAFLPPRQHHPELLTSPAAQRALRELTTARDVVETYARVHAAHLRGWRTGWTPLTALTADGDDSLLELVAAAADFRDANEGWGSEDDWDAAFHGGDASAQPARSWLFARLRRQAPRSDYAKTAEALSDALRRVKRIAATPRGVPGQAPEPLGVIHMPSAAPALDVREARWSVFDDFYRSFWILLVVPFAALAGWTIFLLLMGFIEIAGPEMTPGAHTTCTVRAVGETSLDTSCGVVDIPESLRGGFERGVQYDFVAEQAGDHSVATSVAPTAAG